MSELSGHKIKTSNEINKSIEALVSQLGEYNSKIDGPRDPAPEFHEKNQTYIKAVEDYRGRPLFYPYIGTGAGHGVYAELEDGSVKMDLINGIGIHILGHGHPKLVEASLRGALNDMVIQGNLQLSHEHIELSQKLVEIASKNSRLKYCWITTSGSMANENALKMSRQKNSPAKMVISMEKAFAGRTTLMAEVTDNPNYKQGLPSYDEVLRIPFYDPKNPKSSEEALSKLKEHVSNFPNQIACFCFEPMLGEGGYSVAPRDYFVPLLEFCKEQKIAVWADEVQTFCRTGEFFAYETLGFGEYVDLCTIAKTVQVGATLYTEEYNPKPGLIAGTFAGASAALCSGKAILDEISQNNYLGKNGKIQKIHDQFVGMLNELNETTCKGELQNAGGLGLMVAVTPFDGSKDRTMKLLKTLYKNGLMTFGCGRDPYRLRFLIPAIMTEKDIQVAKKIIEKSIIEDR